MTHIGKYREIPITLPDGQEAHLLLDSSGRVVVSGVTLREELVFKKTAFNNVALMQTNDLNEFLFARKTNYATEVTESVNPETIWLPAESWFQRHPFHCPENSVVEMNSREVLEYGECTAIIKLPSYIDRTVGYPGFWLAFEHGTEFVGGLYGLEYVWDGSDEKLRAYCGTYGRFRYVDITNLLPTDYKTANHKYDVKVHKAFGECFINDALAALLIPSETFQTISGPPYGILLTDTKPSSSKIRAILECAVGNGGAALDVEINSYYYAFCEGVAVPPRVFRLYQTATNNLLAGLNLSAGSVTSHPVPIVGYSGKTIYFRADQTSVADGFLVEVLTQAGNWITYDSTTYTPAGSLLVYSIAKDALLVRITFTPTAYPCTINDAEAVMS